jgi:ActR/RegA family two-component response regulator
VTPRERVHCVLLVGGGEHLRRRLSRCLQQLGCDACDYPPEKVSSADFWRERPCAPAAVVIDLHEGYEPGRAVLQALKRARIDSPVIVLTPEFSREFGTKIVSLGVSYCLARDCDDAELFEALTGLVVSQTPAPRPPTRTTSSTSEPPTPGR